MTLTSLGKTGHVSLDRQNGKQYDLDQLSTIDLDPLMSSVTAKRALDRMQV
jgi:hypothetical protein